MKFIVFILACLTAASSGTTARAPIYKLIDKGHEIVTTYLFGDDDDVDDLNLKSPNSSGFIQLAFNGEEISIDYVRRPTRWKKNEKFCSFFLNAALYDFIVFKLRIPVKDVKRLSALNIANDPIKACSCYVGVMVRMGFNRINDDLVFDPYFYCSIVPTFYHSVTGEPLRDDNLPNLPQVNPFTLQIIKLTNSYTKIQPIGRS